MSVGWIGVDFDGTLADYRSMQFPALGKPVPRMLARVKAWLKAGTTVKIVTARATGEPELVKDQIAQIKAWCLEHLGQELEVTAEKTYTMVALWDDRAVQVVSNTGARADGWNDDGWQE